MREQENDSVKKKKKVITISKGATEKESVHVSIGGKENKVKERKCTWEKEQNREEGTRE